MLRRRKHGTTGRLALPHQHRRYGEIAETVRSAPGRDPRMPRFIRILSGMARERRGKGERKRRRGGAGTGGRNRRGLTLTVPAVSFGPTFAVSSAPRVSRVFRGIDDGSIHFSGAGFPGGRHGQGPGGGFSGSARGFRRGRCGARGKAHRDHLGRAGRDLAADRKRPAGAHGGIARRAARAPVRRRHKPRRPGSPQEVR